MAELPPGATRWFRGNGFLLGTGSSTNTCWPGSIDDVCSNGEWNIPFNSWMTDVKHDKFLIATGDFEDWLITTPQETDRLYTTPGPERNTQSRIEKSSVSSVPYTVDWSVAADPSPQRISLQNYVANAADSKVLFAAGSSTSDLSLLSKGIQVYINQSGRSCTDSSSSSQSSSQVDCAAISGLKVIMVSPTFYS